MTSLYEVWRAIAGAVAARELCVEVPRLRELMHNPEIELSPSDYRVERPPASCDAGAPCPLWFAYRYARNHAPFPLWLGHPMHFDIFVDPSKGSWELWAGE